MDKKEAKTRLQMLLADRCWDCRYGNGKCERDCEFKQATNMAIESLQDISQSEKYKKGFEDAKRAFLLEYTRESENMQKRNAQLEVMLNAQKAISADTEQVVYCKDCVNRGDIFCPIDEVYTVNDNDYCSYGVKKIDLGIDYDTIRV